VSSPSAAHEAPASSSSELVIDPPGSAQSAQAAQLVSIDEAARLLGRDRSRVYALLRSGDLVALPSQDWGRAGVQIDRSSLERWALASAQRHTGGRLLAPRNAWALIGLACGDDALRERCLGLLERPEELSRLRARLAGRGVLELASQLRRRASVTILHLPRATFDRLERDATLVRSGASAAKPYGWNELAGGVFWALDAYVPHQLVQELILRHATDQNAGPDMRSVMLRAVDGLWPFPAHCQLAPQPLAALDLLEYPDRTARRIGREVLRSLEETTPAALARRSARARVRESPRVGKLLGAAASRRPRPVVDGNPRTDTPAAAAHILGVLWASARQGATVRELRAAIGFTRERLEAAYEYLLEYPLLGLTIERHGDELRLVADGPVGQSVERHRNAPRPVALSTAAREVLAIVAYRQPVSQAGIEGIRGTSSDSALGSLLQRQLVALDEHRLCVTTPAFLEYFGLRDLADLPSLASLVEDEGTIDDDVGATRASAP
jgi:segregation and condensation protein B